MSQSPDLVCPLCSSRQSEAFHQDNKRPYLRCPECKLVFVPASYHLSFNEEKAEYDLHRNNPDDQGYRAFLSRLFQPLMTRLPVQARGLDFGSGPGPTLSVMFEEAGFSVANFDPFYANDSSLLDQSFDFITATEVVEHLRNPRQEFERLFTMLDDGGYLGIMTKLVKDREAFKQWHYKNDPTHISFFSRDAFVWLANRWQMELTFIGNDVVLLKKNAPRP